MDRSQPRRPTTRLQVSGYRFLLRRLECALLGRDIYAANASLRAQSAALGAGCVLAAIGVAGCALLGVLRPQADLGQAGIVMGQQSGALYVRVGDAWHPVLNLASARLIAATAANPQPVPEFDLARTRRGPSLGIPGAPQSIGAPLRADESAWTICDTDGSGATTVVVGPTAGSAVHRLAFDHAILVAPPSGSPAYLLFDGQRAVTDLSDAAVVRALRLEGHAPRHVSQALLNAVPEGPPLRAPRIRGLGTAAIGLPGFSVGSVLRIARGDADEYYVVLPAGVQRIGRVAADLLRFSDSQGTANAITVAPDAIRAAAVANVLPVAGFPDRAPELDVGSTLCVTSRPAPAGDFDTAFLIGAALPVAAGRTPVTLSQADGRGPALDGVFLPPGRSAYVRGGNRTGTRYLVTDTGVRFAIHDDDAARALGLPAPLVAPWPVLAALPSGPELSRQAASVARDAVGGGP
ncbi:type VII secretion protein EccB [Mycobacterium terramassiliense]|uniref:type VII secretion protein EccB n=1 Tax=Mycobacterium terramassiliense TaxID=1841859 RepID=UPI00097D6FEB|nr:type VII secretion protein EccB [Mycobacterium terramassiliense]